MEILDFNSHIVPLSTSYQGDVDITFIKSRIFTEEGFDFYHENFLSNGLDRKINNYSSLYLTDKKKMSDIIDINHNIYTSISSETINSSIVDNRGMYLTFGIDKYDVPLLFFTEKDANFIDPTDRIFELNVINLSSIKITHKAKNNLNYYLSYINSSNKCVFSNENNPKENIFDCIFDKESNKLVLFKTVKYDRHIIVSNINKLSAIKDIHLFGSNYFNINYYKQYLNPKLNTSWVSYNTDYINAYEVNPNKSRNNLENNYLINTQYSYVTGDTIEANILTLKNQKTNKNYSYRSNYIELNNPNVPSVNNRSYTSLFTGNEQEKGDYGITLNYEFYNIDYKFKGDEYTIFNTSESLYPYKQINVNDLQWNFKGSMAGDTPYFSDKIFEKKIKTLDGYGEYLCSWLHRRRNGETVWLDRYYLPEKISYSDALASTFIFNYSESVNNVLQEKLPKEQYYDVPDVYNSLEEERLVSPQTIKSALYGRSFFDKMSDLTLRENNEYIYHRIGDVYVKNIIDSINEYLIYNGLILKNSNDSVIYNEKTPDDSLYMMDGNSYALLDEYKAINDTHEFTIVMWIQSDDWSNKFGYQIFGNLNDKGFALLNDSKITPLITIQNGKSVFVYNTNFELLDAGTLKNEPITTTAIIKDVYRTDHLNDFYTINID